MGKEKEGHRRNGYFLLDSAIDFFYFLSSPILINLSILGVSFFFYRELTFLCTLCDGHNLFL